MSGEHALKDYQPLSWRVETVELELDIGDDGTLVYARMQVQRLNPEARLLCLNGEGLTTLYVGVDGRELRADEYALTPTLLEIPCDADQVLISTRVRIDPATNTTLEGFYASGPLLCTQCEPEGFRHITWFIDRPDNLSRFTTTLMADAARYPVLLANGDRVQQADLGNGRHKATFVDPTLKPCYLFAAVAGDLALLKDQIVTAEGRTVALEIYAEERDIPQCHHAMAALKAAMRWDEVHYGRHYDLNTYVIVAVSYFNMGAMENKGLNIFNTSCVLADAALNTDAGFARVESVIAHEYFHNWSGNRVTCRDWFQLCLKEGLTVYRDQQFSADQGSQDVQRIDDLVRLKTFQFAEDAGPRSHPVRPAHYREINNFYTATVYEKGAEIVRMLHLVLGDVLYRRGMDLYFTRHDGQAVTVEDFLRALSDASGQDLTPFMAWYTQAGTPRIEVHECWDPQHQTYTLTLRQPGHIFPVPFRLGFLDDSGEQLSWQSSARISEDLLLLTETTTEVMVTSGRHQPVPVLLRGFSAPVLVERAMSDEELACIVEHDPDGVSRWQAIQTMLVNALRRKLAGEQVPGVRLVQVCAAVLARADQDPALVARMLTLPTRSTITAGMTDVDPQDVHRAREAFYRALGRALDWSIWCGRWQSPQVGERALADLAMVYATAAQGTALSATLWERYEAAQNMTSRQACALPLLTLGGVAAARVLGDWRERFAIHPLVMDRWFSMQAAQALTYAQAIPRLL
ncbi:MAG: aminopeptidase N [Pseudomonadales bacterium]|nr:aminopeptidase N [Pseudomonadales bacterium]